MELCLRIDLDYVPWDTPDAEEFGHGEPAMTLRLLEFARHNGFQFHFFVSNRVLNAFPSVAEAVLNDGHVLDWLCKHPDDQKRTNEARELFDKLGHKFVGLAYKNEWDSELPEGLKFVTSRAVRSETWHIQDTMLPLRDVAKQPGEFRDWLETTESILTIRPQHLAFVDPKLTKLGPFLQKQSKLRTLRD
jgi:hypothetical protein